MRKILFALTAAILAAGLFLAPASAAPLAQEDGICGDTYTVERGDYLYKIARTCGTTVSTILALNPQIIYPSLIYPGQVLRLTGSVPVPPAPTTNYVYRTSGSLRIGVSTTRALEGQKVTVTISGFPALTPVDFRVGEKGKDFSLVYDAVTSATGTATQVVILPTAADLGEYWVVQAITTDLMLISSITSASIYIGAPLPPPIPVVPTPRVSLSKTYAKAGDQVTVYVTGFPAKAEIDYRVGEKGEDFSTVYDGTTSLEGAASKVITIPADADEGEYWVVVVITTSLKDILQVTSKAIYIYD